MQFAFPACVRDVYAPEVDATPLHMAAPCKDAAGGVLRAAVQWQKPARGGAPWGSGGRGPRGVRGG